MSENWQHVREVLADVLEREPGERRTYLEKVCTDPSLRREVESLLTGYEETAHKLFGEGGATQSGELQTAMKLGAYQIVAPLGAGGMGEVYEARDTKLGRSVAIKVLPAAFVNDPERLARFQHEARMLAALNHPNVATIHGLDTVGGVHFLIMELVPGETLRERIAREGALPTGEALEICRQIARALEAAHAKGIIHRDLKPANVKVTPEGQVKVLDFGLAKGFAGGSGLDLSGVTTLPTVDSGPGRIVGTLSYMSPEQARGRPVDNRADLWSFGCVLYELFTGRQAFRGETFADTVSAVLEREPDWRQLPASTPAKTRDLLRRLLQKDVQLRLCSMTEARVEIEAAIRDPSAGDLQAGLEALRGVASDSVTGGQYAETGRRVWKLLPVLFAAVVLVAVAAFFGPTRESIRGWLQGAAIPQERQVAVLPFEVAGGDPSTKAFADGLTWTLTAELAQLTAGHELQVVPAREVRANKVASIENARKEFGVNLVLTGSLQQSAGMSRVTYELVDTKTRRQLDADTITIAASNPFAGQDQVVESVLRMLEVKLRPAERRNLGNHRTLAADAYDDYLEGRGYLENYDKVENLQNAIAAFGRALARDPTYALAYTGLGEAYWQKYRESSEIQWVKPAQEACARAHSLDGSLAAAHVCLGTLASGTGTYQEAVTEFGRALELEPTGDDAYRGLAGAYEHMGKLAQAEATYRRAIELRPHYWAGYNWLGAFYYNNDRFSAAEAMFDQVITLIPDSIRGHYNLCATLNNEGRYHEAIAACQRSIDIRPTSTAYTNLGISYFYLRQYDQAIHAYELSTKLKEPDYLLWWNLGDGYFWNPATHTQASRAYRQAISLALERLTVNPKDSMAIGILAICHAMLGEKTPAMRYLRQGLQLDPSDPEMRFKAALVYNQLGNANKTVAWLTKAVASGYSRTIIRDTPNFELLHSNRRFQELLRSK
jgi:tetratricopeptide (TPR) repeat protein